MNTFNSEQQAFYEALKAFDNNAWQTLMDCCQDRLLKDITFSLYRRNLDGRFADDIAAETWTRAVENIERLEWHDLETTYHWLRVIAFNRVRNLTRKKQSHVSLQEVEETEQHENSVSLDGFLWNNNFFGASPERELELATNRDAMEHALQTLAPREREIWLRRYLDRDSRIQLAHDYDIKTYTLSRQIVRTRKKLKAYLLNADAGL